jgi:hypothetical protein
VVAKRGSLKFVIRSLNQFTDLLVKKVVTDVVANLVAAPIEGGTPVDTGWARANWIPNIGSPVKKPRGSRDAVGRASSSQERGVATVLATYTISKGKVYISNPVPYIVFLNEGTSKQAPAGFVQRAIRKAVTSDLRIA